jgi:hypothetical protein
MQLVYRYTTELQWQVSMLAPDGGGGGGGAVGLYKLNPADPRLKPPGFNPRTYQVKSRFQSSLFQMQLVPLRRGGRAEARAWGVAGGRAQGLRRAPPRPRPMTHMTCEEKRACEEKSEREKKREEQGVVIMSLTTKT